MRLRVDPDPATVREHSYYHSRTELYRVEHAFGSHVLVEDCRTGSLVDLTIAEFSKLEPLARSLPETS